MDKPTDKSIRLIGIIEDDFVNYKKISLTLEFPFCSFKCTREDPNSVCQNMDLSKVRPIMVPITKILDLYMHDTLSEALVFQGLEPFDSFDEMLDLIKEFRQVTNDDIVIYTGYYPYELQDSLKSLKLEGFENIIIKFGRYKAGNQPHRDEILGVNLVSDNQYAKKLEHLKISL